MGNDEGEERRTKRRRHRALFLFLRRRRRRPPIFSLLLPFSVSLARLSREGRPTSKKPVWKFQEKQNKSEEK